MKKKKRIDFFCYYIFYFFLFLFCLFLNMTYFDKSSNMEDKTVSIQAIINSYAPYVKTKTESNLYKKEEENYQKVGVLEENSYLSLDNVSEFGLEHTYFPIKNTDYYVFYQDIEKQPEKKMDSTPLGYIPFSYDVTTNENFSLTRLDGATITFQESHTFPVEYLYDDGYVVLWNEGYYRLSQKDVAKKVKNKQKQESIATKIAVLNYHFFYDETKETCYESICLEKKKFEEQLKYLQENHYQVLDMDTFLLWKKGQIQLPKKSVLLTVDDGAMGTDTHLIELLEKYKMNGTLFLITAWWKKEKYSSDYLDVESHGHNIHIEGYCSGVTRGAKGLCLSTPDLKKDLEKSISKLDQPISFCFPFYAYDERFIQVVKEVGFQLGFLGGNRKAKQTDDNYKIPRYVILSSITLNDFIEMIS